MFRSPARLAPVLTLLMIGCSTTTPLPTRAPCILPLDAMGECGTLCKLRPEVKNLELEDQLAMIRACQIANAETLANCAAKKASVEAAIRACAK